MRSIIFSFPIVIDHPPSGRYLAPRHVIPVFPLYASGLFSLAAGLDLVLDSPRKTMATYLLGATSVSSGHGGPNGIDMTLVLETL